MYNPHRATINYTAPDGSCMSFTVEDPDTGTLGHLLSIAENTQKGAPSAQFINTVLKYNLHRPSDK